MQELERFKDTVQFVGVARDMDQANVTKYMSKIGEFKAELGAHGITISGVEVPTVISTLSRNVTPDAVSMTMLVAPPESVVLSVPVEVP